MDGIKLDRFLGLLPRLPASLLPPAHATVANNCDFAYGELRNTRDNVLFKQLTNAARSIYTDNGLTFYSWPDDVNAVPSPLASDTFNRMYYTTPTDFRVTPRGGMRDGGGVPASSYRAGVPRPAAAPVLAAANTNPLAGATLVARFHYEYSGVKYQESGIGLSALGGDSWSFTPPDRNYTPPKLDPKTGQYSEPKVNETPATAIPVIRITAYKTGSTTALFDTYTDNSSLNRAAGWALSISKTGGGAEYTVSLKPSENEADKVTRAYVYTLVNTYNEEGPPSPPTLITGDALQPVSVTITPGALAGDYAPIKEVRIYRTADSGNSTDYFYTSAISVLGQSATSFTFRDEVPADALNEPLSSESSYPPDPQLVGLLTLPGGILMAWKGNELHFSDAYRPWSWPPQYVLTRDCNIVGAIPIGSGALVTTTGKPFIISGVSPDAMTPWNISLQQAGVSKWAMAEVGELLIYASNDGLNAIRGNQPVPEFTERYFTGDVWKKRYGAGLSSMRFASWDGRLVVYSSTQAFVPFMISMDEAAGAMTELPTLTAACSFTSPLADQLYMVSGTSLLQFAGGADAKALWASREAVLPYPINFGVAQAVCSGKWTLRFYCDGKLIHTEPDITTKKSFRLPGADPSDRWVVSIEGTGTFRELLVAPTFHHLKRL